jgi:two-component system response regulator AtoC
VDLSKRQVHAGPLNQEAFKGIITRSKKILGILREAELHAASDLPVLISGESGTGKELVARAIHAASPRAGYPFTAINMASLSENLFESAFFGHVRGAFTGAQSEHVGFLEYSHRGTLFLDEIATLPIELQGKLLRVLQEKEFIKLGTNKPMSSDVRFIAATNDDLHRLMTDGRFRKDIFYRLRGAQLHLPPLRERKEDIPLLIDHFLKTYCGEKSKPDIAEEALSMLMAYDYPGNIRELQAIVQSSVNLSRRGPIAADTLPADIPRHKKFQDRRSSGKNPPMVSLTEMEKEHIRFIYQETGGNLARTAKLLEISLNTLRRKLRVYGIDRN